MIEMPLVVFVGYPRKRTERTAMAEAVRMQNRWWRGIGRPGVKHRAVACERRGDGWHVTLERRLR